MLKWLFTLVLAVLIIGVFTPWLRNIGSRNSEARDIGSSRHGRGHIPGDFEVERGGKRFAFPIGSTILLSLLASLIFWLLR